MDSLWIAAGSAAWLGILTSISPCPLASNIAAISFVGRRVDHPSQVIFSGLAYTLGRSVTYVALAVLLLSSVFAIQDVALFLQRNMNKVLGPVLIVTGIFLIDIFNIKLPSLSPNALAQRTAQRSGLWASGLLGMLFALSFCPVSAALFFGSLLPLSLEQESMILMPTVYGAGTALPVVGFTLLLVFGARLVSTVFDRIIALERIARRLTGVIFLLIGVYYSLVYLLGINFW